MTDTTSNAPRAQRYHLPVAHDRMAQNLCPECGAAPDTHSNDQRFWIPRGCDLTRVGVEDRIAAYVYDTTREEA